jgi:hypothetical protein
MNGEGFAFFRWHALRFGDWPMEPVSHTATADGQYYCFDLFEKSP